MDGCTAGLEHDTIKLRAGTYKVTRAGASTTDGDLDVYDDLTIVGKGVGKSRIKSTIADRVLHNGAFGGGPISLTLSDLSITGGNTTQAGGGIVSEGERLTMRRVAVIGNHAISAGGIGVALGKLVMSDSYVAVNVSEGSAGGINLGPSTENNEILRSLIEGNHADSGAGGLFNQGSTTLSNVTISDNSATNGGGIGNAGPLDSPAELFLSRSTLFDNSAEFGANIIAHDPAIVGHTIVAGPRGGPNCNPSAVILSVGHNLESTDTCGFDKESDLVSTGPRLSLLVGHGGPTETHALEPSSPGVNAGTGSCSGTDQRRAPRTGRCDIGAYERVLCGGVLVNRVGTADDDRLVGTSGPDGILGLFGGDTLIGRDGADGICGGASDDILKGGRGDDRLYGQGADDSLFGGPGTDFCIGGTGANEENSCERP